jgi:hypothetical protein
MSNAVQEKNEINMFGLSIDSLNKEIERFKNHSGRPKNESDYAVCVMSDAQEEISRGNLHIARLYINKAKYALCQANKF